MFQKNLLVEVYTIFVQFFNHLKALYFSSSKVIFFFICLIPPPPRIVEVINLLPLNSKDYSLTAPPTPQLPPSKNKHSLFISLLLKNVVCRPKRKMWIVDRKIKM